MLPEWALDAPHRCLYLSDQSGTVELYAWDRAEGNHRQVTDRPNGTLSGALTPDGNRIWWFSDTDGDEWGHWVVQPFEGGPDTAVGPSIEPAYSAGLSLGHDIAVIGRSTDDGTQILALSSVDGSTSVLYEHKENAYVGGLSRDQNLLAVGHSEHGDTRHMALRVLSPGDGASVAEKWDGDGLGVSSAGFAPINGDSRLLVSHERRGRPELLVWDVVADTETEILLNLPGEVTGSWYPDAAALLIGHDYAARTELYRYDLAVASLHRLDTAPGVVSGATARPDGTVEMAWSSSVEPPAIRTVGGGIVLAAPGEPPPEGFPLEDAWVDGPGGPIHALVVRPPRGQAPYATAFLIHGGPESSDEDAFRARRAAYAEAGYAVVHVNYRGSTGYGSAWRDALTGRPGLTECADIAAVQEWAISSGLADPVRCILTGGSWGGFLTLLGLGTQPNRWAAGVAEVPVADYLAAYEDEMEGLRAFDRALFGGSPTEIGDSYRRSSPITYVEAVRAPVLLMAGANDPRCPLRQIENYLGALVARGHDHEVYRFDAGHGSLVIEETIRQVAVALDFCLRRVPPH
ncbi:MAG: prolyl oligopeptidase family serine peptidase [Actinomycetota bacterium]|nr:prolyl oligopeptidase family serine peptidase [Actinomycetota bacterium]